MTAYAAMRAELERKKRSEEALHGLSETIVVFTDASYNNQRCCGAIAFSAFKDDRQVLKKAMLINRKSDVTYLELLAVHTALRDLVVKMGEIKTSVEVYCDSASAVHYIKKEIKHQKKKCESIRNLADKISNDYPFISIKHIEAHTGRKQTSYLRNAEVDHMCKKKLRQHFEKEHQKRVERDDMICALVAAQKSNL